MTIKEVEYDEDGNIIFKVDADSEESDSDQEVRESEEEEKDSVTELSITGSEESSQQYAELVAAELDSGQQLQLLNNSLNTLIIIVFFSVVIKILFRIVDEIF